MMEHRLRYLTRLATLLLLVLTLFSACSSHDDDPEAPAPVDILSRFDAEGKAWMSLNINLPELPALTRTDFNDGIGSEYAAKTLTLVLFSGDSEAAAKVASTAAIPTFDVPYNSEHYTVSGPDMWGTTTDQVTCTIQVSSDNIKAGDNVYLLVVLNAPTGFAPLTGTPLSALTLSSLTTTISGTDYFVMANAPLASASDGTGTITTLPKIDPNLFFSTEDAAKNNPAATVYVERAAAKVTTTLDGSLDLRIQGNQNIDFAATDFYYSLFNYNTSSYLVRNVSSSWLPYAVGTGNYRFTETAALPSGQYRTYWAQDQNYSDTDKPTTAGMKDRKAMGTSDYCAENTFSVASMKDESTTSVLIALKLNGGNHFYTTSVTGSDVIYQMPANAVTEEGTSASSSFSRRRSSYVSTAKTIDEYLREWLMQTNAAFRNWVNTYAAGEPKHVNISVQSQESGFGLTDARVTSVTQTSQASGSTGATAFANLELVTYFTNNIKIKFYEHGWCYYRVPIRHFTDAETPWASAATMTNNTTAQAYGSDDTAENNYLGRYGVVRNNWYTINIRSVTHVGYPIIPPLTSDADDTVEQLLNATLQISGWNEINSVLK